MSQEADRNQLVLEQQKQLKINNHSQDEQKDQADKQNSAFKHLLNSLKCPKDNHSHLACTNEKCLQSPFVCQKSKNCKYCQKTHEDCFTFVSFQKLLEKVSQKRKKPQKIVEFLTSTFNKWIDMISDTLYSLESALNSYGLTSNQEELLKLIEQNNCDKISSMQLSQISKELLSDFEPNTPTEVIETLEKQIKSTTNCLQQELLKYQNIVNASKQGKLDHQKIKMAEIHLWRFDKNSMYASNFVFQNEEKSVTKAMNQGKYYYILGTKKFHPELQSQFSILIQQTQQRSIMFGIGFNNFERSDLHYSKDCVAYWSFNGNIWHQGKTSTGGKGFQVGDIVTIKYQPQSKKVIWMKNFQFVGSYDIPQRMVSKDLYPVFGLLNNIDKLTIFDQK